MSDNKLSPYVVITREQLCFLLSLAKIADIGYNNLDCEGIPLSDEDYRNCYIDCNDEDLHSERLVNDILNELRITHDVDYRKFMLNRDGRASASPERL